jgi:RNA polymerase sigma-70 factor (ECF subfamily)
MFGPFWIADAEDIVQAAIIKLLRGKGLLASKGELYTVVRSAAADVGRIQGRETKRKAKVADGTVSIVVYETVDEHGCIRREPGYLPDRNACEPDLRWRLERVLKQISPEHREVLILYWEGYDYNQIARRTKTSLGTVRSRLYYARKAAQELLSDMK